MHDAVATGKVRIIGRPFDAIAKHFGITYYFCTRDYATKNADVLARFRRGVAQAAAYAMSHQSELVPLAMEYTGLSRTQVEDSPVLIGSGADPQMLQPVIDFAAKYKSIPNGFPARELFDPAALTA
jgi:ABC-type nitrate/sulfonate/bicarbonate transport system substrate-binding protein